VTEGLDVAPTGYRQGQQRRVAFLGEADPVAGAAGPGQQASEFAVHAQRQIETRLAQGRHGSP